MTYKIDPVSGPDGQTLIISGRVNGAEWLMACDDCARPLYIRRNGRPYPTLPKLLGPMRNEALAYIAANKES